MPMAYQDPTHIPHVMTMHGGATDVVVINFATSSATLYKQTKAEGGFAINCNHGGIHCGAPGDLYSAAIDFLFAHPFGVDPLLYAGGLPPGFPAYCTIM